ncbi:hypothetical protein LCGC14_0891430 [marine sediment metagenome]|uniref:Uncharacterized protein n=1 Tax=marine sediment metagenome TaxID=412755 RepID=A0A0F9P409_9ZZZZ
MPYQPFLITFGTGKFIGLEPWLSPQDGFPTLENMFVNKRVLQKRLGFSPFATMKHGAVVQSTTSITGIKTYLSKGFPHLLIIDTTRANLYNAVDGSMTDISSDLSIPADIFSGGASNFIHFLNWQNVFTEPSVAYMTNNVDQVHKWAGPSNAVVPFNIKISSDTKDNHVDTCRFLFVIDDRLVLLDTVEFGDHHPQRLRFGPVLGTDLSAPGSGSDDAETQEVISAAGMIGKTVYAFFEGPDGGSLWRIRRTGNTDIPLEWERITNTEGSRSPYSGVKFKDGLAAIGLSNILFTDGSLIQPIRNLDTPSVRDILTEFNDTKIRSVFGHNQKQIDQRHLLWTFANSGSSSMDRLLDMNVNEGNFTKHKSEQSFFLNCLGSFNGQKVPSWVELDDVIGDDGDLVSDMDVDSRAVLGDPQPFTLIGCRNSQVYKWNHGEFDGTDNDNGKIAIKGLSARLNPFLKQGRKAMLEKVEIYLTNDSNASFTVALFKNTSTSAYKTKVISADLSNDKDFVTIFADGEIGKFHRLQISHTERNNTPRIHAFIFYFKPAGRLAA